MKSYLLTFFSIYFTVDDCVIFYCFRVNLNKLEIAFTIPLTAFIITARQIIKPNGITKEILSMNNAKNNCASLEKSVVQAADFVCGASSLFLRA